MPGEAMAPAAHGHGQILLACEGDGCDDIGCVHAAYDKSRILVNHAVPDLASVIIVLIVPAAQCAGQCGLQVMHGLLVESCLKHEETS